MLDISSFFGGFQRVGFRHTRAGLPFVSVCLFMKSHTVQARGGFNRGSVVLSASGRGAGYWSSGWHVYVTKSFDGFDTP